MIIKRMICFLFILQVQVISFAQNSFTDWPKGTSPEEIGLRVAERFLASPHGNYGGNSRPHIPYFEVCTWYGALSFAKQTKNKDLTEKLIRRFDPLFDKDSALLPVPDHVDYTVFGAVPFEIYLQTKDKKYFELGKYYADKQWGPPPAGGPR